MADALDSIYAGLQRAVLDVAEAMPADKYSFRPTPEVRTFGEQLRHIAACQWVVAGGLLNEKPSVDVGDGDSGPLTMVSKPEIVKYAQDSFAYMRRAVQTINEDNALETVPRPYNPQKKIERLALIVAYLSHGCDHFGQMVVYQRMNGIVPPPSREQEL